MIRKRDREGNPSTVSKDFMSISGLGGRTVVVSVGCLKEQLYNVTKRLRLWVGKGKGLEKEETPVYPSMGPPDGQSSRVWSSLGLLYRAET